MRYSKKPKYRIDAGGIASSSIKKREDELSGEELYKEMLRSKRRKAR